jgi:hypothetical protein
MTPLKSARARPARRRENESTKPSIHYRQDLTNGEIVEPLSVRLRWLDLRPLTTESKLQATVSTIIETIT